MPLCALKIGEHVWKVVGSETKNGVILEYTPKYSADEEKGEWVPDPLIECVLAFVYVRTNQNGLHEYRLVDCGKVVKKDGKGIEEEA
jgi:hypothetical protein